MSIHLFVARILAFVLVTLSLVATTAAQDACGPGNPQWGEGQWGGGPPEPVETWNDGNTYLLAVGNGSMLTLYDSSVPSAPVMLGEVLVGDPVRNIAISADGQLAAVSDQFDHLHIVDIGDPTAPSLRGGYDITGGDQPTGMAFAGNRLHVAVRHVGLIVLDIADPDAPTLLGTSDGSVSDYVFDVDVRGDYAYLAQRDDGVQIVDISDPAMPTVVGAHAASTGAARIVIVGVRAYVARGSEGLDILDLSAPTTPSLIGTVAPDGYFYEAGLIGTQYLAISSSSGTLVYDIGTASSPTLAGSFGTYRYRLATQGNYAFASPGGGLSPQVQILDIGSPTDPVLAGTLTTDGTSYDVRGGDGQILVANGQRGLVVLDASNPLAPTFAGRLEIPGTTLKTVERVNGVAAVGGYGQISVVDTGTPSAPVELATIDIGPNYALDLAASGQQLYAAEGFNGVQVYDLAVPTAPQPVWQWTPPSGAVLRVAVDGSHAFASVDAALHVLQLADPAPPTAIDGFVTDSNITDIVAADDHVYVATQLDGVRILDNSTPGAIVEVASINLGPASAYGLSIDGGLLYVAAGEYSGMLVYDITDPTTPTLIEQRNTSGGAVNVHASGGRAVLAEEGNGVRSFACPADIPDTIFTDGFDSP